MKPRRTLRTFFIIVAIGFVLVVVGLVRLTAFNNQKDELASVQSRRTAALLGHSPPLTGPRYNNVQFKASHNSIDHTLGKKSLYLQRMKLGNNELQEGSGNDDNGAIPAPISFSSQIQDWGCRAIEFDLVQQPMEDSAGEWHFVVQHGEQFSDESRSLDDCLQEVKQWSDEHPKHPVITILVDIKHEGISGNDLEFAYWLDNRFTSRLGKHRIFTPCDLWKYLARRIPNKNSFPTERLSALMVNQAAGWPKLDELAGKFIVVISGDDSHQTVRDRRRLYSALPVCDSKPPTLKKTWPESSPPIAFVDIDHRILHRADCDGLFQSMDIASTQRGRVFLNLHTQTRGWESLSECAHRMGFVTRAWKVNSHSDWAQCLSPKLSSVSKSRINMLATDEISRPWSRLRRGDGEEADATAFIDGEFVLLG